MNKLNIRTRILLSFSLLLLFSFSLIGIVFNAAAMRYIQNSAIIQLDELYDLMQQEVIEQAQATQGAFPYLSIGDRISSITAIGNVFRIQSKIFILDSDYHLYDDPDDSYVSDDVLEIMQALENNDTNLNRLRNERVMTAHGVYYLSALSIESPSGKRAYLIISADVTGLTYFAGTVNFIMIVSAFVTFIISVFVTFFLSASITRPIMKLSMLASNIGQGDFAPNDFKFRYQEFADLNKSLNKSARQLGIYDSEQKTFFQNVSHELRSPLMSIKCYAEGISFGLMDPQDASATILQETDRLTDMVQNLLYISKIDNITTTYTIESVDLEHIIRACAERHMAIAEQKHLHFSFDFDEDPVSYDGVGELLVRAVDNLVSNAIRYASSEIILSCNRKANNVTISVTDDGPGIDPESLSHLFERFYKGPGGNQGIGLSIVKSIIEQHNGKIEAENISGGGAMFTITLPHATRRK